MTYAFTFDASACSGCKACQVACKDKNQLPLGVLWRRVVEVSGGEWKKQDDAWTNTVFAYNLSIACNHCVHPKCAGVCPTDAYVVREDGIVYLDTSKCMGCGYCAWACPYAAPQYNPEAGHITKCDFCYDNIDMGLPPACVAACPMRVLDFGEVGELTLTPSFSPLGRGESKVLWETPAVEHPFPLPAYSHTEPHLVIKPHDAMTRANEGVIDNTEEIKPQKPKSELPLVAFTLLTQMAVGAFWSLELVYIAFFNYWDLFTAQFPFDYVSSDVSSTVTRHPLLAIGPLLALAGLVSLLHLGAPCNAWRSLAHLRKSWLSREILFFGLFATSWALTLFLQWYYLEIFREPTAWLTAGLGGGLIYSMAQVYRLHSVPAWGTWRATAGFFVTALLLGRLSGLSMLGLESLSEPRNWYTASSFAPSGWSLLLLFGVQSGLLLSGAGAVLETANKLRLGLIVTGIAASAILLLLPDPLSVWSIFFIFLLAMIEEVIGRWLFYEHLRQRVL